MSYQVFKSSLIIFILAPYSASDIVSFVKVVQSAICIQRGNRWMQMADCNSAWRSKGQVLAQHSLSFLAMIQAQNGHDLVAILSLAIKL